MSERGLRVLVCGGRDFEDEGLLWHYLDGVDRETPIAVIIHGAARGADSMAGRWAQARGKPVEKYPADWKRYGTRAGPIRNIEMLRDGKPDMVVAFKGGKGTDHMTNSAFAANVRVLRATTITAPSERP